MDSSFFLDKKLTNIINFNNDKLLLGLYDEEKKISIIRELALKSSKYPSVISEGKYDDKKGKNIKNILEINDRYILVNTAEDQLILFKKKNEVSKIFKKEYNRYNKEKIKIKKEKEKAKLYKIQQIDITFKGKNKNINYSNINEQNYAVDDFDEDFNNYISIQKETIKMQSFIKENKINIINENKNNENSQFNSLSESYNINNNTINSSSLNENISKLNIINNIDKNELKEKNNIENEINMKELKEKNSIEHIKINKKEEKNDKINEEEIKALYFFFPDVPKIKLTEKKPKEAEKPMLSN